MTLGELIERIDNIPIVEEYKDREGKYIGKALTRWVDVKPIVLEILKEMGKEEGTDGDFEKR